MSSPAGTCREDADRARTPRLWLRFLIVLVFVIVGIPMALIGGCSIVVHVLDARASDSLAGTAKLLVAGTPYAGQPVEDLPEYDLSGRTLCMDNCLYLSFEVPAEYAPTVADNVTQAGWTVDIPGCLTTPEREGPPCGVVDENGHQVAIADYWPGPGLFVMVGPG
jgi:hypothetical protein